MPPPQANHLAKETSPYLLQHAHNPVDWYPWGEKALEKAHSEDKPILLSIGYSACHWCHVMAHESFEDAETAEIMNREFVCVKVDREERPEVDAIYMSAVQALTGSGGWPLTVALTPAGKPFFGGTYFPPQDRYGQPGFKRVLLALAGAWKQRREEVLTSADEIGEHLAKLTSVRAEGPLQPEVLEQALGALQKSFDARHGGFGGAPKFPPHGVLEFLLRCKEPEALKVAESTLEPMAKGGIYDQLGGGFARYSTDERWLVPHFEKMLYDSAQLLRCYAEAYQRTGKPLYKRVAQEALDWARREMLSPEGGFYSALDADSEGAEGKFYLWDEAEIDTLLGEEAKLAKFYYGVSSAGNFEGRNILHVPHEMEAVAQRFGLTVKELESKLSDIRRKLFEAREKRAKPGLDDKILCSQNGLMLEALAAAGRILGREDYLELARANARFIRRAMYHEGRLWHSYKGGQAKVPGLLEDYACLGLGLLALYRATFESEWFLWALELAEVIIQHFRDPAGGFFSTADDAETLITRPKEFFDAGTPSDNGAAAELLLSLARYTDSREWEELAAGAIRPMAQALSEQPTGFGTLLCALEQLLSSPREIALFGDQGGADTAALLGVVNAHFLPFAAVALVAREDDPLIAKLPFLQGRGRIDGKATAYVCESGACRLPAVSAKELREQLEAGGSA
jgi:uncharacterized protein YyaL (SSP411 family)